MRKFTLEKSSLLPTSGNEEIVDQIKPSLSKAVGSMHSFVQGLRKITLRNAAILAAAMLLIYIAFWYYLKDDPYGSMVFSDLITILINALATLCLLYAATISGIMIKGSIMAGYCCLHSEFSFFLGDVFFAYYDLLLEQSTSPSLADLFYLLSYPLFLLLVHYYCLPPISSQIERIKMMLDTGIVMISAILIFW